MDELRCIAANGLMHANGFPPESLDRGLEEDPHFIGVDTGSTDSGPASLGSGVPRYPSRQAVNDVLRVLLTRAKRADIPLLIGSAGTAGARPHLEYVRKSIKQVAEEEDLDIHLASIYSDMHRDTLNDRREDEKTEPLGYADPLTDEVITESEHVVGVMGPEPYIEALDNGADVVLAGRSSDVAIYKAVPIREGFDEGVATHMAKTIECGGLIAKPNTGGECLLATLTDESFQVRPTNPDKYVDPLTISSHMLYEQTDPYRFVEPRGTLDTTDCTYEAVDDRTVEVKGATFEPADQYTVKIEGARELGHRAIATLGIRDPVLVQEQIDPFVDDVREYVHGKADELDVDEYEIHIHVYGKDGVMGDREPTPEPGHEIGLFIDIVAPEKDDANALSHLTVSQLQHAHFSGRKCTAGNISAPMSPKHVEAGKAYEFSIYHTVETDDPLEFFDVQLESVGPETQEVQ